jgi:hypothetical protein
VADAGFTGGTVIQKWTGKQRDVSRAIRGAKNVGIDVARIEIDPRDGTLTILPLRVPLDTPEPNEWGKALAKPPVKAGSGT